MNTGKWMPGRGIALAGLACIAALFLLPFLWPLHTAPLTTFYNEWTSSVLLLGAFAAFCLLSFFGSRPKPKLDIPVSALLFVPLVAIVLVQWAMGRLSYASDALFPLWTMLLATGAVVLGSAAGHRIGPQRLLLWISLAAVLGAFLNLGVQILQYCTSIGIRFRLVYFDSGASFYGALGQVNHLATYFSWGLIGTLYLYAARKIHGSLASLLTIALLVGAALTASRTSWVQILWISLAAFYMCWRMPASSRPVRWPAVLILPLLYAAVNMAMLALRSVLAHVNAASRTTPLERLVTEPVGGARITLLEQGWQIFMESPWIGVGPGQLFFNQFVLLDRVEATLFATSSHNVMLDLLIFVGLTGALPFVLMLGLWFLRAVKVEFTVERTAAWLMLWVLGIHAMLELPHMYAYFVLPAAFFIGMLETRYISVKQKGLLQALPAIVTAYGIVVSASLLIQYKELEALYMRYYTVQRFIPSVDTAGLEKIESFRRQTWFSGPTNFLLAYNLALNENALQQKLRIVERAVRQLPEPNIVYRYVVLLALDGRQEEGVPHLARLRKSFPVAYDEIADEVRKLAKEQPAVFGKLSASLLPAAS